jgi:hypothetical protein
MTYYRVQRADRDVSELLDEGFQFSNAYNGNRALTRVGVSTCTSLWDLAIYLESGQAGGILAGLDTVPAQWVVVELEGTPLPGAVDEFEQLVRPTRIVSVTPVDALMEQRLEATAFLATFSDPNLDE